MIKYDSRKIVFTNAQSLKQEGIFYRVLIDDFAVYKELLDKNLSLKLVLTLSFLNSLSNLIIIGKG